MTIACIQYYRCLAAKGWIKQFEDDLLWKLMLHEMCAVPEWPCHALLCRLHRHRERRNVDDCTRGTSHQLQDHLSRHLASEHHRVSTLNTNRITCCSEDLGRRALECYITYINVYYLYQWTRETLCCFFTFVWCHLLCLRCLSYRLPNVFDLSICLCVHIYVPRQRHFIQYAHTHLTTLCPGLPGWAGTRKVKPRIWILLKQETVSGSGISWAICKSAPRSRQITMPSPHHSVFYRPDALSATQPTVSKHWRHEAYTIQYNKTIYTKAVKRLCVFITHEWSARGLNLRCMFSDWLAADF